MQLQQFFTGILASVVNGEVLGNKRAEYGKEVVKSLSRNLTEEYGKGWSEKQLRHCLRIAETFPDKEILYTLCRQLSWSHEPTLNQKFQKSLSVCQRFSSHLKNKLG